MTIFRSDRDLLTRFRDGDRAALERVYWEYVDRVTDTVRYGVTFTSGGRVAGVPAQDLVDLVQEVFTRAFGEKARLAYDGLRPYRPYLMTICRNLLADWARRRGREIPSEQAADSEGPAVDSPPAAWATPEIMAIVQQYVATLAPPISEVYEHRFRKGQSQAQVANVLGLGRQRIRTMETKIRRGLAAALQTQIQRGNESW